MFLPIDIRLDGPRTLSCMCHAVGVYGEDWFGFSCLWTMVSKSQFVGRGEARDEMTLVHSSNGIYNSFKIYDKFEAV